MLYWYKYGKYWFWAINSGLQLGKLWPNVAKLTHIQKQFEKPIELWFIRAISPPDETVVKNVALNITEALWVSKCELILQGSIFEMRYVYAYM